MYWGGTGGWWQQTQQELRNQNIFWTNYRYQQDQLFLMQQQNAIMQQNRLYK